ncbi:hypothetical protein NMG60_11003849 [Bertholletia excelsa]
MEGMKKKVFAAVAVTVMATSVVQNAMAAEAPAPTPTSDATTFVPAAFASLAALFFGILY